MWRLEIERIYEREICGNVSEMVDRFKFEFPSLEEAKEYILMTKGFGVGKFKYHIEYVEKEGEEEC